MTTPAHLSPVQYVQAADGSMSLKDLPHLTLVAIEEQGTVIGHDWQRELGLPTYHDEWEALAHVDGLGPHRVAFVLADESKTRLPGGLRLCPPQITLPQTVPLEIGHTGFVVGVCFAWCRSEGESRPLMSELLGMELPGDLDGEHIVGFAQLFQSRLAEIAWVGLQQHVFTHVCPNILQPHGAPAGTGTAVQVTLTPGDFPGCQNARVLRFWDE